MYCQSYLEIIMKKTLLKISLAAVLILSTQIGHAHKSFNKNIYFSWPQIQKPSKRNQIYSHYLALNTEENLKAYHLGLKALFLDYHIPTVEDLIHTIRIHPLYSGKLNKTEGIKLSEHSQAPFIIFEEQNDEQICHFYIACEQKLRHFSVKSLSENKKIASIENAGFFEYPTLNRFLQCTFSRHLWA